MEAGCEHGLSKYHKQEGLNCDQIVNISFWLNATQHYGEGGMMAKK